MVSLSLGPEHPLTPPTPVEALMLAILAEVRGLRAELSARGQFQPVSRAIQVTLSRADLELLGRLLPAIGGVLGSVSFLTRDLFDHDSAALRVVLRGLNAKRIGRLLQRGAGQAVDGFTVERAGAELHAVLWRVVGVPGSGLPAVPPRAPGSLP